MAFVLELSTGHIWVSPSRAQFPPSPFPFNACHAGYSTAFSYTPAKNSWAAPLLSCVIAWPQWSFSTCKIRNFLDQRSNNRKIIYYASDYSHCTVAYIMPCISLINGKRHHLNYQESKRLALEQIRNVALCKQEWDPWKTQRSQKICPWN